MRSLVLILVSFALVLACTHPKPPAPPTAPAVNLACQQARTIDKNAACLPLRTAVAGVPDLALADVGTGILVRCSAGEGMGAGCAPFADLRPKQPEQPKPAPSEPAAALTPSTPVPATVKVDQPKAAAKKPDPKK